MAFEILARLGLNSTGFHSGLKRAESAGVVFSRSLRNQLAGAFTVGALVQFTRKTIELGSEIQDTSDRLGISTKRVQELSFAAKQTGSDLAGVSTAYTQLAKSIEGAKKDPKGADANALAAMGLSLEELKSLNVDQVFDRIASRMKGVSAGSREIAVAMEIFGKGGAAILPLLVSDFEALAAAAPVMRDETVKALDDIGDSVDELSTRIRVGFAENVLPPIASFINKMTGGAEASFTGMFVGVQRVIDGLDSKKFETWGDLFKEFGSGFSQGFDESVAGQMEEAAAKAAAKATSRGIPLPEEIVTQAERAAPSPRGYQPQLSSLQRIGAAIENAPTSLERRQLEVQMKMERHLSDIKNSSDNFYA